MRFRIIAFAAACALLLPIAALAAGESGGSEAAGPGLADLPALFATAADLRSHPRIYQTARRVLMAHGASSLPLLRERARDDALGPAQTALRLLADLAIPADEALLADLAGGEDPFRAPHALEALYRLFTRLPDAALLARVRDAAATTPSTGGADRARTVALLAALADRAPAPTLAEADVEALLRLLHHPAPAAERNACRALGFAAHRGDAVEAVLADRLAHVDDASLRAAAAEGLGRLGRGKEPLRAAADDPDPRVRLQTAAARVRLGDGEALAILHDAARRTDAPAQPDAARRSDAARLLGEAGTNVDGGLLGVGGALSPERRLALEFLADLGRPASEAVGAALLNDPSWRVRRHAAALLGRLQGGGMSTALRDALADPDLRVRRAAAEALAAQGARGLHWRFVRVLERESADPLARAAAADALTALGAPGAAPALRDALAAEDFRIACAAADALGALAADDPDADTRAALVGALRTRPFPVNAAAALALAKRSGQPFAAVVEEVP